MVTAKNKTVAAGRRKNKDTCVKNKKQKTKQKQQFDVTIWV